MNSLLKDKGEDILKNFGHIVQYEIKKGNQIYTLVLDLKNTYNHGT